MTVVAVGRRAGRPTVPAALSWAGPGALALALTLLGLGSRSIWLDEGASIAIASQHGSALWSAISHDGGNMLAYYLGLHVVISALGDAIWLLRLPSALCAAATAAFVADIAARAISRRAGAYAGSLAAVSLPLIFWGQDVRGYAAMIALVTASFWALTQLAVDGRRRAVIVYALSTALAVMCAIPAALVVPAQTVGIALLPAGRPRRAAVLAMAVALLACTPVAVLAVHRGSGQLFWVHPPSWNGLGQALRWVTSAGMPPNFHATWAAIPVLVVSLAVLALLFAGLLSEHEASPRRWLGWTLVAWIVLPLAFELIESLLGQPVLLTRNVLVSLPGVSLGLAWVLAHPRLPVGAGLAGMAVILALRAVVLAPSYGHTPEDWRAATGYVLHRARLADCIAFYPQDDWMGFDVYVRAAGAQAGSHAPRSVLPIADWGNARPFVESYHPLPSGSVSSCARIWLVDSHAGEAQGPPLSRAHLRLFDELRASLGRRYRVAAARSFSDAARIDVTLLVRRF